MKLGTLRTLLLASALGTAALGAAVAQQTDKAAPIAGKVTLGVTVAEEALIAQGWRASKLLHADVYNDAKQKIGKVDDLIVAPDGTISIAVIDVGGFLGVGGRRVAIPVRQFSGVEPKRVVLPGASKEELMKMPEFKYVS